MIMNDDYILRDDLTEDDQTVAIEIVSDTIWKGVVYRYTTVSFVEDTITGNANIRFMYDIIDTRNFDESELKSDSGFVQYIGTILNSLILEYVSLPEDDVVETEEGSDNVV